MAFVAIALLLGVVSLVLIARGIMLLVQYGGELNAKGKALFLLIPVLLLSSSPIIGFYAAFPFGVFAGILFAAVAGPGDDSRIYLSV
ncbi:MAG TPA: hypothetical protein VFZ23_01200 [Pyrinomonadaceae bacterium]